MIDKEWLKGHAEMVRKADAIDPELYRRYGDWKTVYAAYRAGEAQVDLWLSSTELTDAYGRLKHIPDAAIADYADKMSTTAEFYLKLYFSAI